MFRRSTTGSPERTFGAGEERDRRQQVRPRVADRRHRQRPVREQPCAVRPVVGLVAALVVEPAVVLDGDRERDQREPLDDDEQRHQRALQGGGRRARPRSAGRAQEAACTFSAGACSRYQAIVRSSPSRSGVCRPEAEQLASPARRRGCGAAGRSASRCPSGSRPRTRSARRSSSASSRIEVSTPGAEVHRLGAVVALGGEQRTPRRSPRRRGTRASASRRPRARSRSGDSTILRISAGITCEVVEVEVVARPVEVRRAAGRSRRARTARGRPARRRAPTSSRRRTARSSPRGSRSRARPRGTARA